MHETNQAIHAVFQPLMKLAEANLALMTKFYSSHEVLNQSSENVQQMVQQAQKSVASLVQTNAFGHLFQGMWQNYTEFLTEFSQSTAAAMTQGHAELTRQAEESGNAVIKNIATRSKAVQ
jgi:hypothetical protein